MSAPPSPRFPQFLAWFTYPVGPAMLWQPVATIWTVRPLRLVARSWDAARRTNRHLQLLLNVLLGPVSVIHWDLPD